MQDSEMIRNDTPEPACDRFPLIVKKGSSVVKVYQVKNRDREKYTVAYMTAVNGRVRKTFADLALAKKEASNIAPNLAQGDLEALKLTGRERQIYVDASQTVARTGIPLSSVAREF